MSRLDNGVVCLLSVIHSTFLSSEEGREEKKKKKKRERERELFIYGEARAGN
jgi:hypothetical protein